MNGSLPLVLQMALAAGIAAAVVVLAGPRAVAMLAGWARQYIREDAPARHQGKAGTPTMGGLLIILAVLVGTFAVTRVDPPLLFGLGAMLAFGGIGLLDDVLKIRRGRNLGLRARERMVLQIAVAATLGWVAAGSPWIGTDVAVPGLGTVDLGAAYVVFVALFLIGFANAVNLTDGLDGLAAGLVALTAFGLAVIGWAGLQPSAAVLGCAVAASAAAFLLLNAHPARVFMGDVGSNALGAVLAALAIITKSEIALVVLGGVFVAEALSVILQVAYFKSTGGRRIFRMSPLHHHFELVGWREQDVVRRFYLAGTLCLVLGLLVVA
jgi:phospho-N-acetylmuramoyl-pentapeptide-transferase